MRFSAVPGRIFHWKIFQFVFAEIFFCFGFFKRKTFKRFIDIRGCSFHWCLFLCQRSDLFLFREKQSSKYKVTIQHVCPFVTWVLIVNVIKTFSDIHCIIDICSQVGRYFDFPLNNIASLAHHTLWLNGSIICDWVTKTTNEYERLESWSGFAA